MAGVFAQWSRKFTDQPQREAAKEQSSQGMWATSGMFVILLQTVDSQVKSIECMCKGVDDQTLSGDHSGCTGNGARSRADVEGDPGSGGEEAMKSYCLMCPELGTRKMF